MQSGTVPDVSILGADVVVVGAGSSGAVVAARLASAGADIVLVEAGPDYGPLDAGRWPAELLDAAALATTHDWGYHSGERWTFERARVLGGCSAHNGAIAAVGHRDDYDAWNLGGWTTDELRPYFATALEMMRVRAYTTSEAGPFHARCLEAARSAGLVHRQRSVRPRRRAQLRARDGQRCRWRAMEHRLRVPRCRARFASSHDPRSGDRRPGRCRW